MTRIYPFSHHRIYTDEEMQVLLHDRRPLSMLAIIYGTNRSRIQDLRNEHFKRRS